MYMYMYVYMNMYSYYIHTYIHTYIHIYIYISGRKVGGRVCAARARRAAFGNSLPWRQGPPGSY